MIITVLYNKDNGCDYHRLLLPIQYLELDKNDVIKIVQHKDMMHDETAFKCDILFISRLFFCSWDIIDKLKEKFGFKIVIDIDDHYILNYHHILKEGWEEFKIGERLVENCKRANMVFVTNEQLYNVYKEFNPNILIIPNALPFDNEPYISHKIESDKKRFMYVAGSTHLQDLKLLQGFFKRIGSDGDYKKQATFTLCGYNNPHNKKENIWNKMEAICRPNGNLIRRESLPLGKYITHYNHGDISIAPLENNIFSNSKSNLKFIEAACMKHPFICSNILPYTVDKVLKNRGIIFCDKTEDWYKAFKFFIHNPTAIKEYAEINYEYAKNNYNLQDSNILRTQSFINLK